MEQDRLLLRIAAQLQHQKLLHTVVGQVRVDGGTARLAVLVREVGPQNLLGSLRGHGLLRVWRRGQLSGLHISARTGQHRRRDQQQCRSAAEPLFLHLYLLQEHFLCKRKTQRAAVLFRDRYRISKTAKSVSYLLAVLTVFVWFEPSGYGSCPGRWSCRGTRTAAVPAARSQ